MAETREIVSCYNQFVILERTNEKSPASPPPCPILSPVLHPSFFIPANDAVVVTPLGAGLQGIFQDLNFPASHPLLS